MIRTLTAFVTAALSSCAAPQSAPSPAPIQLAYDESGLPMVHASLHDGAFAGWFVFDTGSSGHVIHDAVAESTELRVVGRAESHGPSGVQQTSTVAASDLVLGDVTFDAPRFTKLDLSAIRRGDRLAAGVIGVNAFEDRVLEFDYLADRLVLHDRGTFDDNGLVWRPMSVRRRMLGIEVDVEGESETLAIDTGSNGAALFYAPAVRRRGFLESRDTRQIVANNVAGTTSYSRGALASIELAGVAWRESPALFATVKQGAHAAKYPSGNFGNVLLQRFVVFVDYAGERIAWRRYPEPTFAADDYVGDYGKAEKPLEIRHGESGLTFGEPGHRFELVAWARDRFHARHGLDRVTFVREDGGVTALEIGRPGRTTARLERRP